MRLIIDFETYSELNIKDVGARKYMEHKSAKLLCFAYKIEARKSDTDHSLAMDSASVWYPSLPWPEEITKVLKDPKTLVYGFGEFDLLAWNILGLKCDIEFEQGAKFVNIAPEQYIDVRSLTARFRYPQALAIVARALECQTEKMSIGKQLINKCCKPGLIPTEQDFLDLYEYCRIDVEVLAEIISKLPADHFTALEHELWCVTYEMNNIGVPIDVKAVRSIIRYLGTYAQSMLEFLPELTGGVVETPGQIQKIRQFCESKGLELSDLRAETVNRVLEQHDNGSVLIDEAVYDVLTIRQLTGLSSTKKFITLANMENNGYVQGNLNHHRAGTGRWGGQGFQYHNLPRAKVDNPEEYIKKFIAGDHIDKPMQIAKALIRPMICAPAGKLLMVSDYTSIENRVLAFLSGDFETLKLFEKGLCVYSDMASHVFHCKSSDIQKKSFEYQIGKMLVLGCGYQMGASRFIESSKSYGVVLTLEQAQQYVGAYREKYNLVVKTWDNYHRAVKSAVVYPGTAFEANSCSFKVVKDHNNMSWLRLTLPSGRALMYAKPRLVNGRFGSTVEYFGYDSKTNSMKFTEISPGLATENIVQATARDILGNGKLNIKKTFPQYQLIISVHDEAGVLVNESDLYDDALADFNKAMCCKKDWYRDLPLKADGYIAKRYKKD